MRLMKVNGFIFVALGSSQDLAVTRHLPRVAFAKNFQLLTDCSKAGGELW